MKTATYWVVGSGENVGKTTVASALLRSLNKAGQPSLGFKPYSAAKFIELIDTLSLPEFSKDGWLCGADGLSLCDASPLLERREAELLQPILFICYPGYLDPLIIRTGSRLSGNVYYWRGRQAGLVLDRPDLYEHLSNLDVSAWRRYPITNAQFHKAPQLGVDHVEKCFQQIIQMKSPQSIVLEGAGPFLPLWRTDQSVDHLIYINKNTVHFFKDLNLSISASTTILKTVKDIRETVNNHKRLSITLPFCETLKRAYVAEMITDKILQT